MSDITRNNSGVVDPTSSQLDPSKEFNQLRPRSLRSSGSELDAWCKPYEGELGLTFDSGAGKSFDAMLKKLDGGKR
jgi:hypothetical protein